MTALNKQALREAAEEATPGRWEYYPLNTSIEYNVDSMDEDQGSIVYVDSGDFTQKQTDLNGAFIAAANPATILALLDELEASEKRIAELEASEKRIAELEASEKRIAELERKEQHSERQLVIDALAGSGEEWSDIEEYMQKWDAERASAAGKGEAS
ncbi:ead/Ea22-like family protein [Enterobacter roggenkampii]|uniref:ead/Ea22-like family protein n=1 Tax=Enterobacter roggenkampii TaxID=1812935 RepID=UPI0029D5ABBE|nr:ead/Ea22-like family protein [Enterobacter roggenkampii]MDX7034701.1 ead/Ea22-like family protein [Enterobacter roggenkampii]